MSRYNCDYIDDGYKERKVGAARVPRQGHLELSLIHISEPTRPY